MRVNFYSTLRDETGKISTELDYEQISINALIESFNIKDHIVKNNEIMPGTVILLNGKNIAHLNGLDTIAKKNDTVDFFPPAAGG